ncbi:MAG: hypothetical protein ABIF18_02340 [archaeon]
MENQMIKVDANDLKKLILNVEIMKEILLSGKLHCDYEGELTDWAKRELEEARKIPDSENISLEEVEKMILSK